MKLHQVAASVPALITALLVSASTGAQTTLGDGTLLHNNLQVGNDGINPLIREPDYAARNYLITGNVTGLGYFHDEVGYTAPFAFRDETSADDLFRFRARSTYTQPLQIGTTHHDVFTPNSYFRPFSDSPQQRIEMGLFHYRTARNDLGTYRTYDYTQSARVLLTGVPARMLQTLSRQTTSDGRVMETIASPLLGVQQYLLEPANNLGLSDYLPGNKPNTAEDGSPGPNSPLQRGPGRPKPVDGNTWKPSLQLGLQITPLLRSQWQTNMPVNTELPPIQESVKQIESALFTAVGNEQYTLGDDVYMDLLNGIDRQRHTDQIDPAGRSIVPIDSPTQFQLTIPTSEQRVKAEAERLTALRRTLGLPSTPPPTDAGETGLTHMSETPETPADAVNEWLKSSMNQSILTALPETYDGPNAKALAGVNELSAINTEDAAALERMIETLNYDLPSLETLAGQQKTRVNKLLLEAETHLANSQYFDAEENYQLVLIGVPRHPMARVGVIHAQLGAGMIRSAAVNLRVLLEQHPELIATRYEAQLLPRPQRLQWVRQEIEKIIHRTKQAELTLLLAYLGYQTRQGELVAYGLDLAQARSPLDPLNSLVRRIWLEQKGDEKRPTVQEPATGVEPSNQPEGQAHENTK